MNWRGRVKIKHLLTDGTSHKEVQECMANIAKVIDSSPFFIGFRTHDMKNIPAGDIYFKPEDYANEILDTIYDFADLHSIWIE